MRETLIKKKLKNDEKGITLIALVITIIVLIILAGVAINMLSGDNGILRQAAEAREQTEEQSTLEQVRLAVTTSMMNTGHEIDPSILKTELEKIDGVTLPDGEISLPVSIEVDGTRYGIDAEGESYVETWYYTDDNKITNGTTTIELGDEINYNPAVDENGATVTAEYISPTSKNGYTSQDTDSEGGQKYVATAFDQYADDETFAWRVLGVEKGQILIMPTKNATTGSNSNGYFRLGTSSSTNFTNSQNAYVNAVNELDSISAVYGHGKGADGARSVKVEDVNNITGYIPEEEKQGAGNIYGYGNEVTYSKEEDGYIYYDWSGAATHPTKGRYQNFTYWTGSEWKTLGVGESVTLTKNCYNYYAPDYKEISPKANDNVYSLLFDGIEDDLYYWLGSSYVSTNVDRAYLGVFLVYDSNVSSNDGDLFDSSGFASDGDYGVRPAVYLKSDINLTPNETNAWDIN